MRVGKLSFALMLGLFACKRQPPTPPSDPSDAEPTGQAAVIVEAQPIAPACNARSPRGALALVPGTPAWVFHINPRELMQSQLWSLLGPEISKGPEFSKFVGAFDRCSLDWRGIEHVIVGVSADSQEFVAIMAAPGIGQPEAVRCLMLEFQAEAGNEQIAEVEPWPGDPGVGMIDLGDGRAYLFADDLFALVTLAWQDEVGELSRCVGRPALEGPTDDLLARVDINAPLWLVTSFGPEVAAQLDKMFGVEGGSLLDATVSMRLDAGVTLAADVMTSGPSVAATLADSFRTVLMLAPPAFQRMDIETDGGRLLVHGSVSAQELRDSLSGI